MYDADALEAINVDQLVTPTDRLLLRGGQMSRRRRPARSFATGSQPHIVIERFAQGSQPDLAIARLAPGTQPGVVVDVETASAPPARKRGAQQREHTAIIRSVGTTGAQMFAMTVVIPALVGVVVGLAALL
ncbi:MAG TPA: hypothetical protein VFD36_27625 [Kofleriaceae bacterium]|nr:hypothetical protein [Kofleriaceae bacterium]